MKITSIASLIAVVNSASFTNYTSPLSQIFPDRNNRQKYLNEFAVKKRAAVKKTKEGPIKVLFWNANLGFSDEEVDFGKDPSWSMDCPVDCLLTNRREALEEAHVVVYADLADKKSLKALDRKWQRPVIYARTPVMYYQEKELERADWLASFNEGADIRADESHNAILAALYGSKKMDSMEAELMRNDPKDLWTRLGLMGQMPVLEGRINNTIAVFLEDCISFDAVRGKKFVEELQKQFSVHTYGACFRGNQLGTPPSEVNVRDPVAVIERMRSYRFVLVLENTRVDNYVSEQLYYALAAGAIPAYVGAPNINQVLNIENDAVVMNVDSKTSPRDLAYELHKRKADDEHWQRFQWWRGKGHFPISSKYAVTRRGADSVPCQICKLYKHHMIP